MGRKLEFCKEKALEQAMDSFWKKGYASTSMRDLADNLGLHLGSVYNALGDKEKVFESSLKLHFERRVAPELAEMRSSANSLRTLHNYVNRVYDECTGVTISPGCFLVNSLLTITSINAEITQEVHKHLGKIEEALTDCVKRGQDSRQISTKTDPSQCAHMIMAACTSMWVMKKFGMPNSFLGHIRDSVLKLLEI